MKDATTDPNAEFSETGQYLGTMPTKAEVAAMGCNADLGHPCDANDGKPCDSCQSEHDYWQARWEAGGREEYARSLTYEQDMRDAGRGHLLQTR